MTKDNYKIALQAARDELADLEREKAKIEKRISELQQGIVGLSALADDEVGPQSMMDVLTGVGVETGLTDAVRMITSSFGFPMTPKQVRDALLHLGYDLSGYSNILASLHTIMKRLAANGELNKVLDDQGKEIGAYAWNPTVAVRKQRPLSSADLIAALDRAILRVADGIAPPSEPRKLTRKQQRQQAKKAGLATSDPPYKPVGMADDEGKPKKVIK